MRREADQEVLFVVNLVRVCQATHTLPFAGGIFDQDPYFMYLFMKVLDADQKRSELDQRRAK